MQRTRCLKIRGLKYSLIVMILVLNVENIKVGTQSAIWENSQDSPHFYINTPVSSSLSYSMTPRNLHFRVKPLFSLRGWEGSKKSTQSQHSRRKTCHRNDIQGAEWWLILTVLNNFLAMSRQGKGRLELANLTVSERGKCGHIEAHDIKTHNLVSISRKATNPTL